MPDTLEGKERIKALEVQIHTMENIPERITRIEEQMYGLREQHRAHADKTEKMFETLFKRMEELYSTVNKGRGMFTASLIIVGAIGGIIVKFFYYATGIGR